MIHNFLNFILEILEIKQSSFIQLCFNLNIRMCLLVFEIAKRFKFRQELYYCSFMKIDMVLNKKNFYSKKILIKFLNSEML